MNNKGFYKKKACAWHGLAEGLIYINISSFYENSHKC